MKIATVVMINPAIQATIVTTHINLNRIGSQSIKIHSHSRFGGKVDSGEARVARSPRLAADIDAVGHAIAEVGRHKILIAGMAVLPAVAHLILRIGAVAKDLAEAAVQLLVNVSPQDAADI